MRSALIEGRLRVLCVVEPNPVIDDPFCLEAVGNFMQENGLQLQRVPHPFDKDVVHVVDPPIN